MIYQHISSGLVYRFLFNSMDVDTQKPHTVYMQMETGAIFNRPTEDFDVKFVKIVEDPQAHIVPREDFEILEEELEDDEEYK